MARNRAPWRALSDGANGNYRHFAAFARSFVLGRGAPRARPGAHEARPYENVSITKDRAFAHETM